MSIAANLNFIALDLETTGLDPSNDKVIEVGLVKVSEGQIVDELQSLVFKAEKIDPAISKINGIYNFTLGAAPLASEIFPQLKRFVGSDTLVAHNADFDRRFLQAELFRLNLQLNNSFLCSLKLSRVKLPKLANHKLINVARSLEIDIEGEPHRALTDARLTAAIWLKLNT